MKKSSDRKFQTSVANSILGFHKINVDLKFIPEDLCCYIYEGAKGIFKHLKLMKQK